MSEDTLNAIVPALIALAGTLITVYIGIWQWRSTRNTERSQRYSQQQQDSYRGLWEKLEAVHIQLRVDRVDSDQHTKLVQDVNSYILKNAIYLDDADHTAANQYLKVLRDYEQLIREMGDDEMGEAWEITASIPTNTVEHVQKFKQTSETLDHYRQQILEKCRKVLSGNI